MRWPPKRWCKRSSPDAPHDGHHLAVHTAGGAMSPLSPAPTSATGVSNPGYRALSQRDSSSRLLRFCAHHPVDHDALGCPTPNHRVGWCCHLPGLRTRAGHLADRCHQHGHREHSVAPAPGSAKRRVNRRSYGSWPDAVGSRAASTADYRLSGRSATPSRVSPTHHPPTCVNVNRCDSTAATGRPPAQRGVRQRSGRRP